MKLKISYEVKSKTILPKETQITDGERTYTFHVNDEGVLSKITITAEIKDPTKFYSKITRTPDQVSKAHFELKTDKELYDSIIKDFQDLESLLSFAYNVREFDWNSRTYNLICETEEEKANATIFNMDHRWDFPDDPVSITEEQLRDTLRRKERLSELTILFSFYREGRNEYKQLRFISAFYNFYFIIEAMYGNGKTRNKDVAREFKNSTELRGFVENLIDEHILVSQTHLDKLTSMLKHRNMTLGIDAILELIVKTRGELFHFTGNPNRVVQGTPFNNNEFHTISFVLMGLALPAIQYRVVEINQAAKEQTEMSDNGQKEIFLNADELLSAISQYLARQNIKYGPGLEFQWVLTPEDGYEIPPMKDIGMRIKLGEAKR